jgi:hypothetical protein
MQRNILIQGSKPGSDLFHFLHGIIQPVDEQSGNFHMAMTVGCFYGPLHGLDIPPAYLSVILPAKGLQVNVHCIHIWQQFS